MNPNNKFVITINRELGSGGRTVGRKLAEKLGVEFYDKAVINASQEKYQLSVEEIEKLKGQEQGWWADFKRRLGVSADDVKYILANPDNGRELLETEDIFRAETEILKAIAKDESCVIAGRSGFYIFREHPNHLSIFIQASMLSRVARVAQEQNMSRSEARMTIEKIDKMRENYIQDQTGLSRYDTRNYQLVLSMDELTEDAAVDVILEYINKMNEK
ncbi:MAG: cytidylate kinase-like family protein [Paludibacteraceae bacterium]|nr:cytidylate kinase-like family protein [Paludibacteraceae bacterium]